MNLPEIITETCKNCNNKHFLYKKNLTCYTCKKEVCKYCNYSRLYKFQSNIFQECNTCFNETNIKIRKLPTSENGVIREHNIINESKSVTKSFYFSEPALALDHLKHIALLNNFNAVTYLKTTSIRMCPKNLGEFNGNRFRSYNIITGYSVSGIFVKIEKQL